MASQITMKTKTDGTGAPDGGASGDVAVGELAINSLTGKLYGGVDISGNGAGTAAGLKHADVTAEVLSWHGLNIEGFTDGTGVTIAGTDKLLLSDNGTEKYINASQLSSYLGSGDIDGIVTASNSGLAGGATSGTATLVLDINNLAAEAIASGDMLAFNDATDNGIHKESIDDVATLFAGDGLTASSAVLAVGAGSGIDVSANAIAVDPSDFMTNLSGGRIPYGSGADSTTASADFTYSSIFGNENGDYEYLELGNSGTKTTTPQRVIQLKSSTSGTVAAGFGTGIMFTLEQPTDGLNTAGAIDVTWESVADGSEAAQMEFFLESGGSEISQTGSDSQVAVLSSNGDFQIDGDITLGGNIIKASDGGSTITLDTSDNVTIAGDLTVSGGDLTLGGTGTLKGVDALDSTTEATIEAAIDTLGNLTAATSLAGTTAITGTGALDAGSITSGFGNVALGASSITTTGSCTFGGSSFSDQGITNVGNISLDSISADNTNVSINSPLFHGADGAGQDETWYSDTAGDKMFWDSSAEKLTITGTNGATAFNVADGNATFADNVTITGDLTVNGTTSTIATTNTIVKDSLIELGNGTSGTPANDAGLVIERGDSNNAFIGFDESADKFAMGTGTFTGATTGDLTYTRGTLLIGGIECSGNVSGTIVTATQNTISSATSLTAVGALDAGSISSNFGNIDNGSSSIACGSLDVSDGNITNVGSISLDSIVSDGSTISFGADGTGEDVIFYSDTGGDNMTWDSSAEALIITGTNGATALNVADGNLVVADTAALTTVTATTVTSTNIGAFTATGAIDFDSQNMTNVDINSGTIDTVSLGASDGIASINVSGAAVFSGNVQLGNATGDDINPVGRFNSDLEPKTDSTYDLGTSSLQWAELHCDTGYIDAITTGAITHSSFAGNWTNAGRTVADMGVVTTIDINGGTIDNTTIANCTINGGTF